MLETILFEVKRLTETKPYLQSLYLAIFTIAYYGMFRIGEIANSPHAMKAKDIEIADNKPTRKPCGFMQSSFWVSGMCKSVKMSKY